MVYNALALGNYFHLGEIRMKRFSLVLTLFLSLTIGLLVSHQAPAIEKISPDAKAVEVINKLLAAFSLTDSELRLKAVIPLLHKSMYTNDGKDLSKNVKDFSYKKAVENVKFYSIPAVITEVHKGNVTAIGFKETAERGRTDKYFVGKKDAKNGRPAPIHIFFPENGGEPKVVNIGSL